MEPTSLITGILLWTIVVGIDLFGYTSACHEEAEPQGGRFDQALRAALHPFRHDEPPC